MRQSVYQRKTGETDIAVSFNLDGTGKCHADTGIGFFNQCRYFRLCGSGLLSGISYSILTLTFFPENTIPNFKIS